MRIPLFVCAAGLVWTSAAQGETTSATVAAPLAAATATATATATASAQSAPAASEAATPAALAPKKPASGVPSPEELFPEPADSVRSILAGDDATGSPTLPPSTPEVPAASMGAAQREAPNYSGRDAASPSAGDILVWVPRLAFFPLYFTLEFLIRRPLVWLVTRAEEYYVFERIERFITFRDGKSIIFPTFIADFGLRPSAGLTNTNRDLFFDGNTLSLSAAYGGNDFIRVAARNDTIALVDNSGLVSAVGEFVIRPDQPYYGTGTFTRTEQGSDGIGGRYNYQVRRSQIGLSLRALLSDLNWVRFGANFKDMGFSDDGSSQGPRADRRGFIDFRNEIEGLNCDTVEENVTPLRPRCTSRGIEFPEGYDSDDRGDSHGYQIIESFVNFKLDTRSADVEFDGGTGLLFEGFGSFGFGPANVDTNFIRWGGEAAAFWDITGKGHVLALRVYGEFLEDTGSSDDPVPFTELPSLGGLETMRGFLDRRFIGDSVFLSTLSYRYPIWAILDAEIFAEVGNAFEDHYDNFSFERLHLSTGASIRTRLARDSGIQILFALGSRRFEESETGDFKFDSVRFSFGVYQGF